MERANEKQGVGKVQSLGGAKHSTASNAILYPRPQNTFAAVNQTLKRAAAFVPEEAIYINETVQAALHRQHHEGPALPEDKGRMLFLPIDDEAYDIQLFLRPDDADDAVLSINYLPAFLAQWPVAAFVKERAFAAHESTEVWFDVNAQIAQAAANLCAPYDEPALEHLLRQTERATLLLRLVTQQINLPFAACPVPACRFLAHDSEREKIFKARAILDAEFDEGISVKGLARRVAMNECYLKKGFKTLIGKSIHEYILSRRTEAAHEMLRTGRSVTEVAALLGYSSISHFSTAFKKATGMKPCELLFQG